MITRRFSEVFPEVQAKGFDAADLLYQRGSGVEALLYGTLFWPEFAEYRGLVVRTVDLDGDQKRLIDQALDRYRGSVSEAERSVNWVDVRELFHPDGGETTVEDERLLVELLTQTWGAALHAVFPTKSFVLDSLDEAQTGGGLGLVFSQRQPTHQQ